MTKNYPPRKFVSTSNSPVGSQSASNDKQTLIQNTHSLGYKTLHTRLCAFYHATQLHG